MIFDVRAFGGVCSFFKKKINIIYTCVILTLSEDDDDNEDV